MEEDAAVVEGSRRWCGRWFGKRKKIIRWKWFFQFKKVLWKVIIVSDKWWRFFGKLLNIIFCNKCDKKRGKIFGVFFTELREGKEWRKKIYGNIFVDFNKKELYNNNLYRKLFYFIFGTREGKAQKRNKTNKLIEHS